MFKFVGYLVASILFSVQLLVAQEEAPAQRGHTTTQNQAAESQEVEAPAEIDRSKIEEELKNSQIIKPAVDLDFLRKNFPELATKYKGKVDAQFYKAVLDAMEANTDLKCSPVVNTVSKTIKDSSGNDQTIEHYETTFVSSDKNWNELLKQLGLSNLSSAFDLQLEIKDEFDALYASPEKTFLAQGFMSESSNQSQFKCSDLHISLTYQIPPSNQASKYIDEAVKVLKEKGHTARYDGENHKHIYSDKEVYGAGSVLLLSLNQTFLFPELKDVAQKFRASSKDSLDKHKADLTHDTNGINAASRSEPLDILASIQLNQGITDKFNPIYQREIIKERIRHSIDPNTYKTKVFVYEDYAAGPGLHIDCSGQIEEFKSEASNSSYQFTSFDSGFFGSYSVPESTVESAIKEGKDLQVKCDGKWFSVKVKKVPTPDFAQFPVLSNHSYKNENPDKIKAVGTFGIIDSMTLEMQKAMIAALAFSGYELKSSEKTTNFKEQVKEELKDSHFYFPTAHALSLSEFPIGTQESQRLVFTNKNTKPEIDLVLYVPTPNCEKTICETLKTKDIVDIFEKRAKCQSGHLTVTTISCYSDKTLRQWMHAFYQAHSKNLATEKDLPVLIAPSRGFDTDSPEKIVSHFSFPLNILKLAAEGKDINEITEHLKKTNFSPQTNIGSEEMFKVYTSSQYETEVVAENHP